MSERHLEYLMRVDPDRVKVMEDAMETALIPFDSLNSMVHIENIEKEPASLVFHWDGRETVERLNEALEEAGVRPRFRTDVEWEPTGARRVMEIGAEHFDWIDGTASRPTLTASPEEWARTAEGSPGLFGQE